VKGVLPRVEASRSLAWQRNFETTLGRLAQYFKTELCVDNVGDFFCSVIGN
jgi:hypothetical protein